MKTIIQSVSGVFMLGCAQFALAGADCEGGKCETTVAATTGKAKTACVDKGDCDTAVVAAGQERVHYVVKGMTCGGCSGGITKSLEAIEGVTVKKVCHASGCTVVDYDVSKVKKADVAAAINQGKYAIAAERLTVPVSGMTCTTCTGKVTTALNAIEGVTVKTVCHKSGKAVVDVDTEKSNRDAVVKAITDTGFKAS